jgi:reactive intermediate/imine deaminase
VSPQHVLTLALVAVLASCGDAEIENRPESAATDELGGPVVEYLVSQETAAHGLPFSDAVRVGNLLFLSGQIGVDMNTLELPEGGIVPETRQAMENIRGVRERNGASMNDIVKCTAFIDDISDWPAMNEVYVTYFPGRLPARSAFGADGLALGARVEIECLAVVPRAD